MTTTIDAGDPHAYCAAIPISIPGAIQPHGALVALEADSGRVSFASTNLPHFLGRSAESVLGVRAIDLAPESGPEAAAAFSAIARLAGGGGPSAPSYHRIVGPNGPLLVGAHLHDRRILIDFESAQDDALAESGVVLQDVWRRAKRFNACDSDTDLCALLTEDAARLTGFHRVMVYRFASDWTGDVVAEARIGDALAPLRNLRFPATDIPPQARALYAMSQARVTPDVDYAPVPIIAEDPTARPLDLSFSRLRSLAEIHLAYQRILGVRGAWSVSILLDGRLWGLLIGHHAEAKMLAPPILALLKQHVDAFTLRLHAMVVRRQARERDARLRLESRILEVLAATGDYERALLDPDASLVRMFNASGAALMRGDHVTLTGVTPPVDVVRAFGAWLRAAASAAAPPVWSTDHAQADAPPLAEHRAAAAGALVVALGEGRDDLLVFFRPERRYQVTWAGDPAGGRVVDGRAHVRTNFAPTPMEVVGRSAPWPDWALDAAHALRSALHARAHDRMRLLEAATARLEQEGRVRVEHFASVAHELRTPLNAILGFSDLLSGDVLPITDDDRRRFAGLINDSAQRLLSLIDDLLNISRLTSGAFEVVIEPCDLAAALGDAQSIYELLAMQAHLSLVLTVEANTPLALADPRAVGLILNNLVGNAVKYTDPGGRITVAAMALDGRVALVVSDTGRGIPADMLSRVTEPFVQSRPDDMRKGAGLGLAIVKRLTELQGGEFRLQSEEGVGSVATVLFPLASN